MRASDGRMRIPWRGPHPPTRAISAPSFLPLLRYDRLFLVLCALIGGVELKGFSFFPVPRPPALNPLGRVEVFPMCTWRWGSLSFSLLGGRWLRKIYRIPICAGLWTSRESKVALRVLAARMQVLDLIPHSFFFPICPHLHNTDAHKSPLIPFLQHTHPHQNDRKI